MATFNHFELGVINPEFDSPLVDVLTELELLRHLRLETDVHPILFVQRKEIYNIEEAMANRLPNILFASYMALPLRGFRLEACCPDCHKPLDVLKACGAVDYFCQNGHGMVSKKGVEFVAVAD